MSMWPGQEPTVTSAALGGEGRWVPPQWCRARGCAACESPAPKAQPPHEAEFALPASHPLALQSSRPRPASVIVVDSDRSVWRTLDHLLSRSDGLVCGGFFETGDGALSGTAGQSFDIALVALALPDRCGIRCVRELRAAHPRLLAVLAADLALGLPLLSRVIGAGISLCLVKPLRYGQCLSTLRCLALELSIAQTPGPGLPTPLGPALSAREDLVLAGLQKGLLYKEVADKMGVSLAAVKKAQHSAFRKLHVEKAVEAVRAWRAGRQ